MNVEVEVTNVCNAKCVFCPHDEITRPMGFMKNEVFTRLADLTSGADYERFFFTGMGEPTLHEYLPDFLDQIRRKYTVVTTNGSLGATKVRDLKNAGLTELVFSINYLSKPQCEERVGVDFDTVVESIYACHEVGLSASANVTISQLTKPQLREIYAWIQRQGIQNVYFCPGHSRGGYFHDESIIAPQPIPTEECGVIISNLFVTWDGEILICSADLGGKYSYGNIMNHGLEHFIEAKRTQSTDVDICRKCDCIYRYKDPRDIKIALMRLGVEESWLTWP